MPTGTIDLVTSHEVLYLEPDVPGFMRKVHRVLALDGHAYVVLGCHAENPLWHAWKSRLTAAGRTVYDHVPLDIMEAASAAGLSASVQPLRTCRLDHLRSASSRIPLSQRQDDVRPPLST